MTIKAEVEKGLGFIIDDKLTKSVDVATIPPLLDAKFNGGKLTVIDQTNSSLAPKGIGGYIIIGVNDDHPSLSSGILFKGDIVDVVTDKRKGQTRVTAEVPIGGTLYLHMADYQGRTSIAKFAHSE